MPKKNNTTNTETTRKARRGVSSTTPESGLALVMCVICGEPTADHTKIGPCDQLPPGGRLTIRESNVVRGQKP